MKSVELFMKILRSRGFKYQIIGDNPHSLIDSSVFWLNEEEGLYGTVEVRYLKTQKNDSEHLSKLIDFFTQKLETSDYKKLDF